MDMIIAAGKSRKNVDAYVLLPPDAKDAIDILLETRKAVGVPITNPYIFARMNADSPLSGTQEMKKNLRKYISTVCQVNC